MVKRQQLEFVLDEKLWGYIFETAETNLSPKDFHKLEKQTWVHINNMVWPNLWNEIFECTWDLT